MRKTVLETTKSNLVHCLKSQESLYKLFSTSSPPHNKSNPISAINRKLDNIADTIRGKKD